MSGGPVLAPERLSYDEALVVLEFVPGRIFKYALTVTFRIISPPSRALR